jgi:hypothetical protein
MWCIQKNEVGKPAASIVAIKPDFSVREKLATLTGGKAQAQLSWRQ